MRRRPSREPSAEHAKIILEDAGFAVEDIAEVKREKRADLRLRFAEEEYILEAKLRRPHAGWGELLARADAEGYASTSRRLEPWNALSSTIMEAYAQLVATPAGSNAFRVLWSIALHDDEEFVISCLEKRLLGSELLVAVKEPSQPDFKPIDCYHHACNDFERCPEMVAAVLGTSRGANLFVNFFSEQREAFRLSRLHQMFDEHGAVVDPEMRVSRGEALMLGKDFVGPRDGKAQWKYLMDRFGVGTSVMVEAQFAGVATLPVIKDPG